MSSKQFTYLFTASGKGKDGQPVTRSMTVVSSKQMTGEEIVARKLLARRVLTVDGLVIEDVKLDGSSEQTLD